MRFEYSAQPSRRDAVVLDIAICRRKTWAHFRQVSVHVHIDPLGLAASCVVQESSPNRS